MWIYKNKILNKLRKQKKKKKKKEKRKEKKGIKEAKETYWEKNWVKYKFTNNANDWKNVKNVLWLNGEKLHYPELVISDQKRQHLMKVS